MRSEEGIWMKRIKRTWNVKKKTYLQVMKIEAISILMWEPSCWIIRIKYSHDQVTQTRIALSVKEVGKSECHYIKN